MKINNSSNRAAGNIGESYAAEKMKSEGCTLLCTGYTCVGGEIDIIATENEYIVFAEVKLRSAFGEDNAAEGVDEEKMRRIRKAAQNFLAEYNDNDYAKSLSPRFDVVELYTDKEKIVKYSRIKNADFLLSN